MRPDHTTPGTAGIPAALACGLLLVAAPAVSEQLPSTRSISGSGLALELVNAVVEVAVGGEAEPSLEIRRLGEGEGGAGALIIAESGGTLHVTRLEEADLPLLVVVALAPEQAFRLSGNTLELSYQAPPFDVEASAEQGADAPPSGAVELDLVRAQADLVGARQLKLRAEDSHIGLERTGGPLRLELLGSTLELRDHAGRLDLVAEGSSLRCSGQRGRLTFTLEETDLEVSEGSGTTGGRIVGGQLRVERRRGALEIAGGEARIELREAGRGEAPVQVRGSDLDVLLERMGGALSVELRGGRLEADELRGTLNLKALAGADLSLRGLNGGLELSLEDGASARLSQVRRGISAELRDAVIELEEIGSLSLRAHRSRIEAREVRKVEQMEVSDCSLDLSLANTNHSPTVILRGATNARVELPSPCSVKILDRDMVAGAAVRTSGCGIETKGHGRRRYQNRGLDGGRAVVLTARVSEDSSLEVEGRP